MPRHRYPIERWIGLLMAVLGIFYAGYFWPRPHGAALQSADQRIAQARAETQKSIESQESVEEKGTLTTPGAAEKGTGNPLENTPLLGIRSQTLNLQNGQVRVSCRVLVVFDGDTLGCDINANGRLDKPEEEIRLLGIDSPEMHYSRKNPTYKSAHPQDEPFAKEASHWLERQAAHQVLYLESDLKPFDRYGRRLAYVYLGQESKVSLNEAALKTGYYRLLFIGKNRRYEDRFRQNAVFKRIQD